jgi:hypothetical protein
MQLVATGKIVRGNGRQVAMQTVQHEFRTTGIPSERRNAQSMLAGPKLFAAFGK